MLQVRETARLLLEATHVALAVFALRRDDLDRDTTAEHRIPGGVDDGHAAAAENPLDVESGNDRVRGHGRRIMAPRRAETVPGSTRPPSFTSRRITRSATASAPSRSRARAAAPRASGTP